MEKLLFVPDIQARYQVSAPTARKIMRQMLHMEKPKLAVTESAVWAYERDKLTMPGEKQGGKPPRKRKPPAGFEKLELGPDGKYRIPKRRE